MMKVSVKKMRPGAKLPVYGSAMAAGADLCACLDAPAVIPAGQTVMVPTGIAMEIPAGYAGLVYARSGLAATRDLAPANKVGVIDADYRGEIFVPIHNHGSEDRVLEPGERMAQIILTPFLAADFTQVDELSDTQRGEQGFGSTGRK